MQCAVLCFLIFHMSHIFCNKHTFYKITGLNPRERKFLYTNYIRENKITFLNGISNEAAHPIYVAAETSIAHLFQMKLKAFDIQYAYVPESYLLANGNEESIHKKNIKSSLFNWDDILKWVEMEMKKNMFFQKIVIAKTYERRDIFILKISDGNKKPIVFIAGGEDGKDWMSSAIILNFANSLLKNTNGDNKLLKEYDFYLLPILNPDGFVYSKKNDRFWSKNRRPFFPPVNCLNNRTAVGVNIDRNWFYHTPAKIIHEECKTVYMGHKPISEEETQGLSFVLNSIAINMLAFINVKGFGKFITIPYANKEPTNNHDIVMDILASACTSVKTKYNITYYVDTTNKFIYNLTGNLADWVKKKLNIPIVFTTHMSYKNHILPNKEDISPLSKCFFTILNETLLITKNIYKPLFVN